MNLGGFGPEAKEAMFQKILARLEEMSTWRERRDAVIEEYLQAAGGNVAVAIQLIDNTIDGLPLPSDGVDLLALLEAKEQLQAQK